MPSPRPDPLSSAELTDAVVVDSEYAVVRLAPNWGVVSIALAILSLPLRFWARHLPWHPRQHWYAPGEMLLGILGIAAVGVFFGWLGLRQTRGRTLAKAGLFLNLAVAGVLIVFAAGLLIYFRLLR